MTWGQPCLQVDDSTIADCLTKAMIHDEQARKTILILKFLQSTDSFKELVSTLLLCLYKVGPHTGLLATYQLSRRLNAISLPKQLIWDELTRKKLLPHPQNAMNDAKNVNNVFQKTKANYTEFQNQTNNRCWFELVWLQIQTRTPRKTWKKNFSYKSPSASVQVRRIIVCGGM